ncbi:hypothetical protein BpHYR1_023932 [Brachionus plicatilis]|uniref:Uncharacterized protein n=1 Tax=Brachionus plicatilis TaxID=10195 RepID=A0A3M7S600_BRAPC|nr:hypothetical protein BpHYR1_023932 [Brachionus plicatilis]
MDNRCEKSTPANLLSREQLQKQKKYSAVLEQSEKIQNLKKMIQLFLKNKHSLSNSNNLYEPIAKSKNTHKLLCDLKINVQNLII